MNEEDDDDTEVDPNSREYHLKNCVNFIKNNPATAPEVLAALTPDEQIHVREVLFQKKIKIHNC